MVNLLAQRPVRVQPPSGDTNELLPPALAQALGTDAPSTESQPSPPAQPDSAATSERAPTSYGTTSDVGSPRDSTQPSEEEQDEESSESVIASLRDMMGSLGPNERTLMAPILRELGLEQTEPGQDARGISCDAPRSEESHQHPEGTQTLDLLSRMDAANTAADGLEAKLDRLLASLDDMLLKEEQK